MTGYEVQLNESCAFGQIPHYYTPERSNLHRGLRQQITTEHDNLIVSTSRIRDTYHRWSYREKHNDVIYLQGSYRVRILRTA